MIEARPKLLGFGIRNYETDSPLPLTGASGSASPAFPELYLHFLTFSHTISESLGRISGTPVGDQEDIVLSSFTRCNWQV
jgi:hypothetical protein